MMRLTIAIVLACFVRLSVQGQPAVGQRVVVAAETLAQVCALTPAQSGTIAIIKGQASVADADGFALYYDRSSTATANGSTIFNTTNNVGRWYRITGMGGGGTYLNSTSDIRAIDTTTLIQTVDSTIITNILTLGRSVKGDMGGGRFFYLADTNGAQITHVNNGTVWRNGNNDGNWYYDLVQAKNGLNVLLWEGVVNTGGVNTIDPGLQDAIDFCWSPTYGSLAFQTNVFTGPYSTNRFATLPLAFPPGLYTIGSITNPGVSMFGSQGSGYGVEFFTNAIVKFQHSPTNHSPMIVCNQSGLTIAGITMSGMREFTITNFQGVTGWGSRTNFTYSGADPTSASIYDRAAFFFDATNTNYLGCAFLDSVGAGAATIELNEDLYSSDTTIPSNDSMLVVFGPVVDINGSTGVANALAGPPAILVYGTQDAGFNDVVIKDCHIDNFHSGVVFAYDLTSIPRNSRILNTSITRYNWAAVSSAFTALGLVGVQMDNSIFESYYVKNSNGEDPNIAYTNKFCRNGRWGIYGSAGNVQVGSLKVQGSHGGVYVHEGSFDANSLNVVDFARDAIRLRKPNIASGWVTNSQQIVINSLLATVPQTGSESYNTWTLDTNATAVRLDSKFDVFIGGIKVPKIEANNQTLPTAYRMQANYGYGGRMHIAASVLADNVTSFRDSTDTYIATTGDLPQQMTKAVRNNIGTPPTGILIYQTDSTPGIRRYSNGAWVRYTETADP